MDARPRPRLASSLGLLVTVTSLSCLVGDSGGGQESELDRVLQIALDAEHPGIDEEGIQTMKGFIASGARLCIPDHTDEHPTHELSFAITICARACGL